MKQLRIALLVVFLFSIRYAFAQNAILKSVTEYPSVDRQLRSNYGSTKIRRVFIGTDGTLVEFEYKTPSNTTGTWISMSSSTILKSRLSSTKYHITNWGNLDKNGNYNKLNFNEKYNVDSNSSYVFYMGFDAITNPTNNISIYEDGYNGFYWEGIHLNDYGSYSNKNNSSEQQKMIAKFIVTSAKENGVDITQSVVNCGAYTVFYSVGDNTYMANYWEKQNTQSWGTIYGITSETTPETSTSYKTDEFNFSWNYQNSYDSKTGTCKCVLTKIYKPQGVVSVLKMVTEGLDVIEYTGYMDGSLDFSGF